MSDDERNFGQDFEELIGESGARDAGMAIFERRMAETQQDATHMNLGKVGYDMDQMDDLADDLNRDWPHYGDYALITGRVYLSDPDLRDDLPAEWGDLIKDEDGHLYFYLENVTLRSHGVEIVPFFDTEDAITLDMKVMYVFSYEINDIPHPVLHAQPDDLAVHQYELPTPDEAYIRLQRDWPKEAALIDRLMLPDLQMALPKRLALLVRQLQKHLVGSDYFRTLVEMVINERITLDEDLPYAATITTNINVFDGEDPRNSKDPGTWMDIAFTGELNTFLHEPEVFLSRYDDDGIVYAHILAKTYNDDDGEDPEYVNIKAEDLYSFRSTRTIRSILSRALESTNQTGILPDNLSDLKMFKAVTEHLNDETITTSVSVEGLSKQKHEPILIRQMEMFQKELVDIAEIIQEAQKTLYRTIEDATNASVLLVSTEIGPKLVQAGIDSNFELEFSGSTAIKPQDARSVPDLSDHPHVIVYGIDSAEPFDAMQDGDSFRGRAKSIQPLANEIIDDDGEVLGYNVFPSIIAAVSSRKESIVKWQGVSVVELNIETDSIVPLDGSTTITIPQLDQYRDSIVQLKRLSKEFKDSEIVLQLNELNRALLSEQYNAFQSLKKVELLSGLDDKITEIRKNGGNAHILVRALESILVGRMIGLSGEIFDREGKPAKLPDNREPGIIGGEIIDVRDDMKDGITVVVNEEETLRYVSLKSVTWFSF